MDEIKKENSGESHKKKKLENVRENPWIVSTFVLGVLVVILLITGLPSIGISGKVISDEKAGESVINFLNTYIVPNGKLTVSSVEEDKELGVYIVNVKSGENDVPVSLTKDGKYIDFGGGIININAFIKSSTSEEATSSSNTNTQTATEVPKSDKPVVELFVFTYCPYGTQAEKGIIPVVKLLGDKIDFKIRQIGAMHGEYEKVEAERQLCIEKEYPAKYLDYVLDFALNSEIGACGGDATCVGPKINALYTKFGISKTKIDSCMASDGLTLYNAELSNAQGQGVSGSPTLIINGVRVNSARDSASYLDVICQAFGDGSVPAECGEQLSSASPSPGFGSTTGSSGAAAQCAT